MNDFTKEELATLKSAIWVLYDKEGLLSTKKLVYRLQDMIDNYSVEKRTIYVLIGRGNSYEASYTIAASVDRQVVQDVEKQFMSDNLEGWAYIIEFKDGEY